jgi:hypothetical protein
MPGRYRSPNRHHVFRKKHDEFWMTKIRHFEKENVEVDGHRGQPRPPDMDAAKRSERQKTKLELRRFA